MVQLLLIRPGTTEYDQQGRVQGTLDIPLCEDGRQEVEAMVEELRQQPVAAIYAAPCQSAEQTAAGLAQALDLKVKTIDGFKNLDHGLWQGMLVSEVKAKQPKVYRQWLDQPEIMCPPQGETVAGARQRVSVALAKLFKKHKSDGIIATVIPEPLASIVRHIVRHDAYGDLWHTCNGKPRWHLLEVPETAAAK